MTKASRKVTAEQRHDDANAFIPEDGSSIDSRDDLAEMLAEGFLAQATSGESVDLDVRDELLEEELGGPFVQTTPSVEFGSTMRQASPSAKEDPSIEKEPFPQAVAPLVVGRPVR